MLEVIALGGNAMASGNRLGKAYAAIAKEYAKGRGILITHGNGPQVGKLSADSPKRNLAVLTAETEMRIGSRIKSEMAKAMLKAGRPPRIALVRTKVVVSTRDREFGRPTKPIGPFLLERRALLLQRRGFAVKRLIGGYRRVVPSPRPKRIVEIDTIRALLEHEYIVIACGGGGIAVDSGLNRVNAVIDKDRSSALAAEELGAARLFILTNVSGVYLNFKTKDERMLRRVKGRVLKEHLSAFEEGSMRPKVEAAMSFVRKKGRVATIGSLEHAAATMSLKGCTVVRR